MTRARALSSRTPSRGTMSSSRIRGTGRGYGDYKSRGRAVTRVQRALDVFFPLFLLFGCLRERVAVAVAVAVARASRGGAAARRGARAL